MHRSIRGLVGSLVLFGLGCTFDVTLEEPGSAPVATAGSSGFVPATGGVAGSSGGSVGPASGGGSSETPSCLDGTAGCSGGGVDFGGGDLTVLLVYDKSGSMAETWDGRGKWQIASDALLAGIVGVEDKLTIGALLFPQPLDCQVEPLEHSSQIQYMSGRQFVSRWAESVATAAPNGATPMGLAFQMADSAIRGASALGLVEGRRFRVLLVTDGEPNCGTDPESLVAYASMWHELGVETHVLGLPGSQAAASLLDHIAVAGSTGGYVAAGDVEQVEDTFHAAVR